MPVGQVVNVGLTPDGWHALVTLKVNGDIKLPANAVANVKQSSLLGEKYVELASPGDQAQGKLADGATIPLARTNRNVEVEELLGALSLLLNGGGVDQLNTITKELNNATSGREPDIKALLNNANELVSNLDAQSANITRAIDGLNRLSATLANRDKQVAGALTDLTPGLKTLEDQRGELVSMLQSLDQLSTVATDVIHKSRADLVADLNALAPILKQLAKAGENLPKALEILPTFPFTDPVLDTVKGDYVNVYASLIPGPGVTLPPSGEGVPPGLPTLPLPGDVTTSGGR